MSVTRSLFDLTGNTAAGQRRLARHRREHRPPARRARRARGLHQPQARRLRAGRRRDPRRRRLGRGAWPCTSAIRPRSRPLFAALDADGRAPDILVNNAAANPYFGPMLDMDLGSYEKTVEVNLRGYFWTTVQAARRMRAQAAAASSTSPRSTRAARRPGQGIYSMTKAGIVNMTEGFAKELAAARHPRQRGAAGPDRHQVRLGASPATRRSSDMMMRMIPLARVAQPDEIAPAVLFLASAAQQLRHRHHACRGRRLPGLSAAPAARAGAIIRAPTRRRSAMKLRLSLAIALALSCVGAGPCRRCRGRRAKVAAPASPPGCRPATNRRRRSCAPRRCSRPRTPPVPAWSNTTAWRSTSAPTSTPATSPRWRRCARTCSAPARGEGRAACGRTWRS